MAARDELPRGRAAAEREAGEGGHRAGRCEREERILRSLLEMPRFWGVIHLLCMTQNMKYRFWVFIVVDSLRAQKSVQPSSFFYYFF